MKDNYLDLNIVLDRSGSMAAIEEDMEGGLRSFISDQKKLEGKEITVSYTTFDTVVEEVFVAKDIKEIKPEDLTLEPRGMTSLLDAVGRAINTTGERLKALKEEDRPSKVTFLIITDGDENSSTEFTGEMIKTMVTTQKETYKWDFVFLGANIDSFGTAQRLGINTGVNYKGTKNGTKALFRAVSKKYTESAEEFCDMSLSNEDVEAEEALVGDVSESN